MKLNKIISLRLDKREIEILKNMERTEKDKSAAARKLINKGWELVILQQYKDGKISASRAAKELDISISELLDMMKELGIRYDIAYEDFLSSQKIMKKIWK